MNAKNPPYTAQSCREEAAINDKFGDPIMNDPDLLRAHAAALEELATLRKQLAERDGAGTEVRSDRRMTMDGTISKAMQDVIEERHRQVSAEGWTPEHDDAHDEMELAMAAAAYCEHAVNQDGNVPGFWPWLDRDWKPKDPRRDLVRAGALILAEIERIDRAAYPKE